MTAGPLETERTAADFGEAEAAQAQLALGRARYQEGRPGEALAPLLEARRSLAARADRAGTLECALLLARVERDLGRLEDAGAHCLAALGEARALADPRAELDALNLRAGVLSVQGLADEALACLEQALDLARSLELPERRADILSNIGTLHTSLGDFPRALDHLKRAYQLLQETAPGTRSQAVNLINLGYLYQEWGETAEAQGFFEAARDVSQEAGDPTLSAAALNNLANIRRALQDWRGARALFEEALRAARSARHPQYEVDNLDGLGEVLREQGALTEALERHQAALALARDIGYREGENDALFNLGKDRLALGQPREALEALQESLALSEQLGRQRSTYEAHELLSALYEHLGDFPRALAHHRLFHAVEKAIFNRESEERTRRLTVQFELERARHEAKAYRQRMEIVQDARAEAERTVLERTRDLEAAQLEVVTRLAVAAEYRDDDTGEHTRRVGRNAAALAYALGWPLEDVKLLYLAARLHDVGKIGISDLVLLKPGKLSRGELDLMRAHTTIGAAILSNGRTRLLRLAEDIAMTHHERWDGGGYPLGLAGADIPAAARIVAVADVLDALTHERPYKRAWSLEEALAELRRESAHHFDPEVVAACLAVFGEGGLCPCEVPPDWEGTLLELRGLPTGTR